MNFLVLVTFLAAVCCQGLSATGAGTTDANGNRQCSLLPEHPSTSHKIQMQQHRNFSSLSDPPPHSIWTQLKVSVSRKKPGKSEQRQQHGGLRRHASMCARYSPAIALTVQDLQLDSDSFDVPGRRFTDMEEMSKRDCALLTIGRRQLASLQDT